MPGRPSSAGAPQLLLDVNALLLPFRERFPLEAALQEWAPRVRWAVPSSAWAELERLVEAGAPEARTAHRWAGTLPRAEAPGRGDAAIVRLARGSGAWVVTADRALLRRRRTAGVTTLSPRGRARLARTDPVPSTEDGAAPVTVKKVGPVQTGRRR